jgi:lactoylglutathione lyase
VKTLHTAYPVSDVQRSADFYRIIGFRQIRRVSFGDGSTLLMLNLPEDGDVVTLELVHNPALGGVDLGSGSSHIVVQVEVLEAIVSGLRSSGVESGPIEHPGPAVCNLRDPDGYRIEFVEWPPGHPDGMTSADFRPPDA